MIKDGIEVYVRRINRGTRYLEYEHVRPKFNSNTSIAYIKAITGEQFEVRIKLHHGFRYYTATGLQVRLCLDANEAPDVYWHPKKLVPADGWETTISDFCVEVGGEWMAGKLAFGDVGGGKAETTVQFDNYYGIKTDPVPVNKFAETTPNPNDEPDFLAARRRRLGTIRVSIQRGHVNSAEAPVPSVETPALQAFDFTCASDADRAAGITHKVTTLDGRPIAEPPSDTSTRFKAVGGPHGERMVFEFRYRSLEELTRLGLCDENGRMFEPEPDEEADEEDGSPIPPVSRRRFSPPLKPRTSQRRSTRNRTRHSSPPALSLERAQMPEPASVTVNKTTNLADKKVSGVEKPPRHIGTPNPVTETHEERMARYERLLAPMSQVMEPIASPGPQSVLRPIKRGQGFEDQAQTPVKKPRLAAASTPTDLLPNTLDARSKPLAAASTTTAPCVQGSEIGIFSPKVKREPSLEIIDPPISRPAPSAPTGSVSIKRSVPSGPGVPSTQKISSHVHMRKRTNAPFPHTARPLKEDPSASRSNMSSEELGIEFRALDVEHELIALRKKSDELKQRMQELELEKRKLKAEAEVARMRKEERLAAGGTLN
ncbi:hypothetical protein IWX50DRAFT_619552 [Phyllosticta citricarpa]